jgi:hypothetical protein
MHSKAMQIKTLALASISPQLFLTLTLPLAGIAI